MTAPRRILHVFPSFAAGGAQMRMAALANHFGTRFSHMIIALDGDISCRDRLDPALEVSFPAISPLSGSLARRLRDIVGVLRRTRPDLLITSNWGAIEWAIANRLRFRAQHIHTEDGFGRDERDRQIPRRVLTRRVILRSSITIVPSHTLYDTATRIWRLPVSGVTYIPNGIDFARFTPASTPPGGRAIVGCVAALRPEKNLGRLIRACAIARHRHEFDLIILGDGPGRAGLEALATELGLPVRFLGAIADPAPVYRDFTIFALSSDTEQMPLSVMEAMASGLPVVATDVGDIAQMVAPENRDCLTPRDDQAMADVLGSLLGDPARIERIGRANRARAAQNFNFATMSSLWGVILTGDDDLKNS
ncbi:MAG: glycosyltransferase family 4 protein [Acidiphilium sp.]|nr:glycosyltransferase family 4 protein [Acidiphilium sp.]MDD4936327.1 glycosyltransferase family 4 protein [Acidiphilium sp.]